MGAWSGVEWREGEGERGMQRETAEGEGESERLYSFIETQNFPCIKTDLSPTPIYNPTPQNQIKKRNKGT